MEEVWRPELAALLDRAPPAELAALEARCPLRQSPTGGHHRRGAVADGRARTPRSRGRRCARTDWLDLDPTDDQLADASYVEPSQGLTTRTCCC